LSSVPGETFLLEFVNDKADICVLDSMDCVRVDLLAERICEKHLTGGDFIGSEERERIFGTHTAADEVILVGEGDIVVLREGDYEEVDTIGFDGVDGGATIVVDPKNGINPVITELSPGADTI
jgi:hypothetical protein